MMRKCIYILSLLVLSIMAPAVSTFAIEVTMHASNEPIIIGSGRPQRAPAQVPKIYLEGNIITIPEFYQDSHLQITINSSTIISRIISPDLSTVEIPEGISGTLQILITKNNNTYIGYIEL